MKAATIITAIAAPVILTAVLHAPALAQTIQADGRGVVTAKGVGSVDARGDGAFHLEGKGQVVVVANRRDDIEVRGFTHVRSEGTKHFFRGSGRLSVQGRGVALSINGDVDAFRATGQGAVHLAGRGVYRIDDVQGRWTSTGSRIQFGR